MCPRIIYVFAIVLRQTTDGSFDKSMFLSDNGRSKDGARDVLQAFFQLGAGGVKSMVHESRIMGWWVWCVLSLYHTTSWKVWPGEASS